MEVAPIHDTRAGRNRVNLRAVIFDYGMVLSGPPNPHLQADLIQQTGIPEPQAMELYWKYRLDYDRGALTGLAYWRRILEDAGQTATAERLQQLADLDARMWTGTNLPLVRWQAELKQAGIRTALLSNLGDEVEKVVTRELSWMANFEVRVFSHQLRIIKPDAAIYLETLKQLGTKAEETLFLDDSAANVEGARALGIHAVQYTDMEALRSALATLELPPGTPLPIH